MEWYGGQKEKIFRNKEELQAYCVDDVNVLRQACCAFRNLFLKLVKMDPFRQAIIKSSICNKMFRTMFLKTDIVVIIPRGGTAWEIASLLMLLNGWRTFVNQEQYCSCRQWAGVHMDRVHLKVDGYCQETNEVFQYLRCFWHGCPSCMHNRHTPIGKTTETLQGR